MAIKQELLEILACPMCKGDIEYKPNEDFVYCEKCDIRVLAERAKNKDACTKKCGSPSKIIKGEVLLCKSCGRWYPIIDDIPHMLPDDLREDLP